MSKFSCQIIIKKYKIKQELSIFYLCSTWALHLRYDISLPTVTEALPGVLKTHTSTALHLHSINTIELHIPKVKKQLRSRKYLVALDKTTQNQRLDLVISDSSNLDSSVKITYFTRTESSFHLN